ncbi:MAG: putative NUDIX family NTP pyrophosphohydrolase [Saprospiraceae bacterium]|jgi:predicted NUDIX family NTP pyrophosphohydrolase
MSVLDTARIIIYRFHEKGLEIFLVNSDLENDPDIWKLPNSEFQSGHNISKLESIQLEPVMNQDGIIIKTLAVEGEWHDIPSIRGMLLHDVKLVKSKIKEVAPEMEKGGFFAVKEAFKKVMPEEYKALKELKSILRDRNLTKYI